MPHPDAEEASATDQREPADRGHDDPGTHVIEPTPARAGPKPRRSGPRRSILLALAIVLLATFAVATSSIQSRVNDQTATAASAEPSTDVAASPPAASSSVVTVGSIPALKSALADNTITEIIVADGTYTVTPSNERGPLSLWIGGGQRNGDPYNFAKRTRPVTVRAETTGGVTLDGGGASGFGGLSFEEGAHDQVWDGFKFANMTGSSSGIVEFGGYSAYATPHHITLRNITIMASCHRASSTSNQEQGIYFAHAAGTGPHDLLLENILIDGSSSLSVWSGIHSYHGDSANPASSRVTIRNLTVTGSTYPIILWAAGAHDWLIDGGTIANAGANAVRYEVIGGARNVIENVTSTGSASGGFYSSLGPQPPGLTLVGDDLQ